MNTPSVAKKVSAMPPPPSGIANSVAAGILEYIRKLDLPAGQRLREQALADELGVSRSPSARRCSTWSRPGWSPPVPIVAIS